MNLNFAKELNAEKIVKDAMPSEVLMNYRMSYRTATFCLGAGFPARVRLDSGETITEDELALSNDLFFNWLLTSFIKTANSLGPAWVVLHGDTVCLNKMEFTQWEMDEISRRGLNIFLYEPISFLKLDNSWPWLGEKDFKLGEISEIDQFKRTRQPYCDINVYVCEYGLSDWIRENNIFPNLSYFDFSSLLIDEVSRLRLQQWPLCQANQLQKKILCLNFRYEALREILVAFLRSGEHFNDCFVSFYHKHVEKEFYKRLSFDPTLLKDWPSIARGIAEMQTELPYVLDVKKTNPKHPVNDVIPDLYCKDVKKDFDILKRDYYSKAFLFAYVESRPFSPKSEMSEKTINPILAMKPFLPFAAPGFLGELRKLGFQTFSDFWSEEYDEIICPRQRMDSYLKTLDFILSKPISEIKEIYIKMQPILVHNRLFLMRDFLPMQLERLATYNKGLKYGGTGYEA